MLTGEPVDATALPTTAIELFCALRAVAVMLAKFVAAALGLVEGVEGVVGALVETTTFPAGALVKLVPDAGAPEVET